MRLLSAPEEEEPTTRQMTALAEIELAREKEGRGLEVWEHFGGPILNESETFKKYDLMLQSMVGKV